MYLFLQAYQHLREENIPKFTVIVAQKNHHTKLFQAGGVPENVPPGLHFFIHLTLHFSIKPVLSCTIIFCELCRYCCGHKDCAP